MLADMKETVICGKFGYRYFLLVYHSKSQICSDFPFLYIMIIIIISSSLSHHDHFSPYCSHFLAHVSLSLGVFLVPCMIFSFYLSQAIFICESCSLETRFRVGIGRFMFMIGLADLSGLFQPKWFYSFISLWFYVPWHLGTIKPRKIKGECFP